MGRMVRSPQQPGSADMALSRAIGVLPDVERRETPRGSLAAYYWNAQALDGFELESSEELILALHTGGGRVWARQDRRWSEGVSVPGVMHLIPNGYAGRFKQSGSFDFVSLHIDGQRLARLVGRPDARALPLRMRWAFDDPFARASLRRVCEELRQPTEFGPMLFESLIDTLWLHLLASQPESSRVDGGVSARIARARDRIEASLARGVSLDELATEAGMSRFHFARAFRDTVGDPPHRYLTRCRIRRATELMRDPTLSLTDIALSVGYSSHSHFCTAFRSVLGRTPRQARLDT